jgi:hypothetical protein
VAQTEYKSITNTNKSNMSTTQITFTAAQIDFLGKWFNQQKNAYTATVMEDEFPADEESFQQLCEATYNVGGFKVGEMVERDTGDTPRVGRKGRVKKEKRDKDPNAPKRAKSAFIIWQWGAESGVAKVKDANPDIAHTKAVGEAGAVWAGMSDEEKAPWNAKSAVEKAKYVEAMKNYVAPDGDKVGKVVGKVVDDVVVSQDVPDGVGGAQVNMYMRGMASKKRYNTLQEAVTAMESVDGAGGVVYDGKSYSLRKSGDAKETTNPDVLWVKN